MAKYDFSGWATRNDILCSDGRTIKKDAFKHNDGELVPLVWNHNSGQPDDIIGHALLENREEGVYTYGSFNSTDNGKKAKELVLHGDIRSLSIFANHIQHAANTRDVIQGHIREVSLVLAGANSGAFIDTVMTHGDSQNIDSIIIGYDENIMLYHSDDENKKPPVEESGTPKKDETDDRTIDDVLSSMTEEQLSVTHYLMYSLLNEETDPDESQGGTEMKHNVFENEKTETNTLSHADTGRILADAKRIGSLREAVNQSEVSDDVLMHTVTNAAGSAVTYGMANIDYLFPDARLATQTPEFITRDMGWVTRVISGAKHLPLARVKTVHANITMDEARAKGYVKGALKTEEVFALLKRTTVPTTIYKKQKLDRDDIVDITDFGVVAWLKSEMRTMLNEEIARAALVGDGRTAGTDDKVSEDNIRPIWKDSDVFAVKKNFTLDSNATADDKAKQFIRTCIKSRKDYKGSGNPDLFTTEDMLTDCLLLEDGNGRVIYESVDKLKTALRVNQIITVPVMEGLSRAGSGSDAGYTFDLLGIIVNMADYGFGSDKGGEVNMFDDFDIDYNQQKYLIETRCSGALMKAYSAIVVENKKTS